MDRHMQAPPVPQHQDRSGNRDRWRGAAVIIGLVVSSAVVWQSTQAAFSATTDNNDNTFGAGSVALTDNILNASKLFSTATNAGNIIPGDPHSACIQVTYNGTLANKVVKLYTAGFGNELNAGIAGNGTLEDQLTMKIEVGAAGTNCGAFNGGTATVIAPNTTTFAELRDDHTAYGGPTPGLVGWTANAGDMRPFRFTYELPDVAPATVNAVQGDAFEIDFKWEVQS